MYPAGDILLILNTDPSEIDLIRGRDTENPKQHLDLHPQSLIRPEMNLPNTPSLLILRSARDKNGTWEGFEDLVLTLMRYLIIVLTPQRIYDAT